VPDETILWCRIKRFWGAECGDNTYEIIQNIRDTVISNGIKEETANIQTTNDLCVEMETGTGKTIVYIKTPTFYRRLITTVVNSCIPEALSTKTIDMANGRYLKF